MKALSRQRGFTLTDVLLTLGLVGVVLAAGAPLVADGLRTYRRNAAARQVLAEIRTVQSLAVTRGGTFGFQWGADPDLNLSASQYRLARDTTGSCGFPAVNSPADDVNVIRGWRDLSSDHADMTILSIRDSDNTALGGVMFDSLGSSTNTCTSVNYPVIVTVSDSTGATRRIEIGSAGTTRLL